MKKDMRIAALPIALLSIVVGIVGIASPDGGMTIRRLYFATPGLFYSVAAVRGAMGLGLLLAATSSRWPRILRALGAVVCLQGLSATFLGLRHAGDHGMGGDAGTRAPSRRGRSGACQRSLHPVCNYTGGAQRGSSGRTPWLAKNVDPYRN
jgi:hypothetical protein